MGSLGAQNVKRKGVTMSLALERRAETDSATYTPTMLLQAVVMVNFVSTPQQITTQHS